MAKRRVKVSIYPDYNFHILSREKKNSDVTYVTRYLIKFNKLRKCDLDYELFVQIMIWTKFFWNWRISKTAEYITDRKDKTPFHFAVGIGHFENSFGGISYDYMNTIGYVW